MTHKRAVLWVGGIAGLVAAAWLLRIASGEGRALRRVSDLQDQVRVLRVRADSCQGELAREEADFRDHDRRVDSLREEVARYESMDERGVPAPLYETYMETFRRYNASASEWQGLADTLQGRWRRCREVVRAHNAVADSLRGAMEELPR